MNSKASTRGPDVMQHLRVTVSSHRCSLVLTVIGAMLVGGCSGGEAPEAVTTDPPAATADEGSDTAAAASADDGSDRAATVVLGEATHEFPGPGFCKVGEEGTADAGFFNPPGRAVDARFTTDAGDELNIVVHGVNMSLKLVVDGTQWEIGGQPMLAFSDGDVTWSGPVAEVGAADDDATESVTITLPCT